MAQRRATSAAESPDPIMNVPEGISTNRIPIEFSKATGTPRALAAAACSGDTLAHEGALALRSWLTASSAFGGALSAAIPLHVQSRQHAPPTRERMMFRESLASIGSSFVFRCALRHMILSDSTTTRRGCQSRDSPRGERGAERNRKS